MFAQERLKAVSKVVCEPRRMTFAELQVVIPASPATTRRDLGELEEFYEPIRVHGGVMDTRYEVREHLRRANASQRGCEKGDRRSCRPIDTVWASVLIDAGTTCLEAGKALFGRRTCA